MLMGMNRDEIRIYRRIKEFMPLAHKDNVKESVADVMDFYSKKYQLIVPTYSGSSVQNRIATRAEWPASVFDLKFAVSRGDRKNLLDDVSVEETFLYPANLVGPTMHPVREHIENVWFGDGRRLIIADDDPIFMKVVIPELIPKSAAGASRLKATDEDKRILWSLAFHFAEKFKKAYTGFRSSEASDAALAGYETPGGDPRRNHGIYGFRPISLDTVLTGAVGVIQPMRQLVPTELRSLKQEYATTAVTAIASGLGTLQVRSMMIKFAVFPPPPNDKSIETLVRWQPDIVQPGNAAGGTKMKTGTVIKLKTKKILEDF